MHVSRILQTLKEYSVDYLLIGGMNYLLRHHGPITQDVDVWIEDSTANRARCEAALAALEVEWGENDESWGRVTDKPSGWLSRQGVFSVLSPHGPIDVFRAVRGLASWSAAADRSVRGRTHDGVPYRALCDADMLACQTALPEGERRLDRIRALREILAEKP